MSAKVYPVRAIVVLDVRANHKLDAERRASRILARQGFTARSVEARQPEAEASK